MNSTKRKGILILVSVLILTVVIAIIKLGSSPSWVETYKPNDSNPFGADILADLLKVSHGNSPFIIINDSLSPHLDSITNDNGNTYVFIGNEYFPDPSDANSILSFVERGNNAILITSSESNLIYDSLFKETNTSTISTDDIDNVEGNNSTIEEEVDEKDNEWEPDHEYFYRNTIIESIVDTTVTLYLNNADSLNKYYQISGLFRYDKSWKNWSFFRDSLVTYDNSPVEILGSFNSKYTNFIRIKYGEGNFYLHTIPVAFGNYYMISDSSMNYARNIFTYANEGTIYWDERSKTYHHEWNSNQSPSYTGAGPLEFILSERGLRYAWYVLLISSILYILFGAKRKQRVVVPKRNMENTSIEYAEVISQLFMKQSDHKKLIELKMDLFKSFLRTRYRIHLQIIPQGIIGDNYEEISQKSGVARAKIEDIFSDHLGLINQPEVKTENMLSFHHKIEYFYNNCK